MDTLRQTFFVTLMNLKGLPARFWSSLVIVVGMACVIGVLLSMLSLVAGTFQGLMAAGDRGRAIVLSQDAGNGYEYSSHIPRAWVNIIKNAPGIARDRDGSPMVDAQTFSGFPGTRKSNGLDVNVLLRGIGPKGFAMLPDVMIVSGRRFRPGTRELIVGITAAQQFADMDVGDKIILPDGEWRVVGIFTAGGSVLESEVMGGSETEMAALRRSSYSSVIARLATPQSLDVFKKAILSNPALAVTVERDSDFVRRVTQAFAFLAVIAYIVAGIMAVGAVFGALNTMYAAVSARTREIATLRALGFGVTPVVVSVIAEALFLAISGALIGAAIAWALFDGKPHFINSSVYDLAVTPGLVFLGLTWAAVIAFLGSAFPAIHAARLQIIDALRAT
jgi:putative ABC transport system permease protein